MNVKWWVALNQRGHVIHIESAEKTEQYRCYDCGGQMIPVIGGKTNRAMHYRHKSTPNPQSCGGEGARHLRVKSMICKLLKSIKRERFIYDVEIDMEKSIGIDRPDIVIGINGNEHLAIEIVDSNPPSEEKLERWGDRMKIINISKWPNSKLEDAIKLCGFLMPYIFEFDTLMTKIVSDNSTFLEQKKLLDDSIEKLQSNHSQNVERLEREFNEEIKTMQDKHCEKMDSIIDDFNLEKSKMRNMADMPDIWSGSFASKEKYPGLNDAFGVMVITENAQPEPGDFVIIQTQKGDIYSGILGELIDCPPPFYKNGSEQYRHVFDLQFKRKDMALKKLLSKLKF